MIDPILLEAKSERELLLLSIQKIDIIDEKLSSVCSQVNINTPRITSLERDNEQTKMRIRTIIGGVTILATSIVYYVLKQIGFPINN